MLENLTGRPLLIAPEGLDLPEAAAEVMRIDFKALGIKPADRALAALAILCRTERVGLTVDMLREALGHRFSGDVLQAALAVVDAAVQQPTSMT
jgi:hypothetical protein